MRVWCAKELTEGCPIAVINADDFYGADAFRKMYDYLSQAEDDDKFRYCMVGYQVENTLTENGTVSRGVCTAGRSTACSRTSSSALPSTATRTASSAMTRTAMHRPARSRRVRRSRSISGASPRPSCPRSTRACVTFFAEQAAGKSDEGASITCRSRSTRSSRQERRPQRSSRPIRRWYGVTYREDKPVITRCGFAAMTADGEYPGRPVKSESCMDFSTEFVALARQAADRDPGSRSVPHADQCRGRGPHGGALLLVHHHAARARSSV
ncbi:MAG: hypothetical protein ACLR4Z_11995 [Butyricicoccaceae bacterium]